MRLTNILNCIYFLKVLSIRFGGEELVQWRRSYNHFKRPNKLYCCILEPRESLILATVHIKSLTEHKVSSTYGEKQRSYQPSLRYSSLGHNCILMCCYKFAWKEHETFAAVYSAIEVTVTVSHFERHTSSLVLVHPSHIPQGSLWHRDDHQTALQTCSKWG